jgi:hypothetical protein
MNFGYSYPVVLFKLDDAGRLYAANGNPISVYLNDQPRVVPRQFRPETVAADPAYYPPMMCSVTTDQTLDCSVTDGTFTYKYWSSERNYDAQAFQMADRNDISYAPNAIVYSMAMVPKDLCPAVAQ